MTTNTLNTGAAVSGLNYTASATPGFIGDGSGLTNIPPVTLTANEVVVTNGSGHLISEAFLGTANGGFGVNPTTLTNNSVVSISGSAIVALPYTTAATGSTLVERDVSGNVTVAGLTTSGITSTGNVGVTGTITASGSVTADGITSSGNVGVTGTITASGSVTADGITSSGNVGVTGTITASGSVTADGITSSGPVSSTELTQSGTNGGLTTIISSSAVTDNTNNSGLGATFYQVTTAAGNAYFVTGNIVLADSAGDFGSYQFQFNAVNMVVSLTPTITLSSPAPSMISSIMSTNFIGVTSVSVTGTGAGLLITIQVLGPTGLGNVNWFGNLTIVQTNV